MEDVLKPIFEYMNYREYLDDVYRKKKSRGKFYSFRIFSQKAGFKSPNFLKLVITGERNLSKESVFKFSKALKHNKREAEYFENLVFFNQAKTLEEKNEYLKSMMKYRKKSDPQKIEESEYKYYSAWWHPVVRELATAHDFNGDFRALGQMVVLAIPAADAEKSVQLLLSLGFIRQTTAGLYEQSQKSLTTGPQVRSVAVANYHRAMMDLAGQSIERFDSSRRDITSLTVAVSDETCKTIIERLQQFRRELLDLVDTEEPAEKVIQVNFQLFPLSVDFKSKREA